MNSSAIKVHIIDDDQDDTVLIQDILRDNALNASFHVECSERISEGISALKRSPAHVVLLDLSLPDASGFDGLNELQREVPSSNIIILTGLNDHNAALDALKLGASDYLNKSEINPILLTRAILYSHERQKLEEQLRQSRKLEAIGQLAGGIAHDFNNQLGILKLLLDNLESLANERPEALRIYNDMNSIVEKCSHMTRQILSFSRKQTLFPSVTDVNGMIQQLAPFISRLLGSDVQLNLELSDQAGSVLVDRNQLEQVIWNLVLNAQYALGENRNITIRTARVNSSEISTGTGPIPDGLSLCMIEVSDTGGGISPEVFEKIFDPFFTTKPMGEGTGLGLSTTLGFIRQSGGYMGVRTRVGQGSSFQIFLPPSNEKSPDLPLAGEPLAAVRNSQNYGILVCDDEPMIRDMISNSLRQRGYSVFSAANGADGMELYRQNSSQIQLIISDLTMPKMSGTDLIKSALRVNPEVKSVLMSGYSNPILSGDMSFPNLKVVNKPFSIAELIRMASELLEQEIVKT